MVHPKIYTRLKYVMYVKGRLYVPFYYNIFCRIVNDLYDLIAGKPPSGTLFADIVNHIIIFGEISL